MVWPILCICGTSGRKITNYTVIYGVHERIWPTPDMCQPKLTFRLRHVWVSLPTIITSYST